jgi:PPM family protein phosphatase
MWFRSRRHPASPGSSEPSTLTNVDVGASTAVGGRADNQDRCHAARALVVVSDGMGGHRGGARAAELSVDAVVDALDESDPARTPSARLTEAFRRANEAVRAARTTDLELQEMGATLLAAIPTAAAVDASAWLVGHVGDSRAFVVRATEVATITVDHNRAAELVAAGVISEDRAATHPGRHLLVRAVGPDPTVDVDLVDVDLLAGDALVLASDGLTGPIDVAEIGTVVRSARTAARAAADLVDAAVSRGATDNVTVVVVRQVPSSAG